MIIPALDIIDGNTVRLYQGYYHLQSQYDNPILILERYAQQGATMIHLVDLTGAQNPEHRQILLIDNLVKTASSLGLKIQLGGGIRHASEIETLLTSGVTRIILGSTAITQPKTVKKWFKYFNPDSLILAIDIRVYAEKDYKVFINAWKKETNVQLKQVIEYYKNIGLKYVLCTDITRDGTLSGANICLYQSICHTWPTLCFQASGGISKLSEISKLKNSGVNDIIIGRSFLEKNFTINEAISCWQNALFPV